MSKRIICYLTGFSLGSSTAFLLVNIAKDNWFGVVVNIAIIATWLPLTIIHESSYARDEKEKKEA